MRKGKIFSRSRTRNRQRTSGWQSERSLKTGPYREKRLTTVRISGIEQVPGWTGERRFRNTLRGRHKKGCFLFHYLEDRHFQKDSCEGKRDRLRRKKKDCGKPFGSSGRRKSRRREFMKRHAQRGATDSRAGSRLIFWIRLAAGE